MSMNKIERVQAENLEYLRRCSEANILHELMFAEAKLHRRLKDGYLMTTKTELNEPRNQDSLLSKRSVVGTDYLFFMELLKGHHTEWLEELLKIHKEENKSK